MSGSCCPVPYSTFIPLHWNVFFPESFGFPLKISFHQHPILILLILSSIGKTDVASKDSNKATILLKSKKKQFSPPPPKWLAGWLVSQSNSQSNGSHYCFMFVPVPNFVLKSVISIEIYSWFFLVSRSECRDSVSNQTFTTSFHSLSNSVFTNHPAIRHNRFRVIDSVVK